MVCSLLARFFFFTIIISSVLSYSVLPGRHQAIRFWQPVADREYYDEVNNEEARIKRNLDDDLGEPYNKRTNLKRLVILSARGFGKR